MLVWLEGIGVRLAAWIGRNVIAAAISRLPGIVILAPRDREAVPHRRVVRGTVTRLSEVQVYVWAAGRWYRQPRPEYDGVTWSCECYFGNPESRLNELFRVIALDGSSP